VLGDHVYTVQGQRTSGEFSAKVYAYHVPSDTWSEQSFGPHAADGVAGGVLNGKIYTFGGRQDWTGPYGLRFATVYDPAVDGGSPWRQVAGGFELRAGRLGRMVPVTGRTGGPYAQVVHDARPTGGEFVLEARGRQSAAGRSWSTIGLHANSGRYNASLVAYQAPYNDFGVKPSTTSIYREERGAFTPLAVASPAATGDLRFTVVSTATAIAVRRDRAPLLFAEDAGHRGGTVTIAAGADNASDWDVVFVRAYAPVEPAVSIGAQETVPIAAATGGP
jgi:hypothetical protein